MLDRQQRHLVFCCVGALVLGAGAGCSASDGGRADRPAADAGSTDEDGGEPRAPVPEGCEDAPPESDFDDDYISKGLEEELGLDPCQADSDADGTLDIAEVALCCDAMSAGAPGCGAALAEPGCKLQDDEFFVELPYGTSKSDTLEFDTTIERADIYLLVDTTGSMDGEIENLRSGLRTLVSILDDEIPDVTFGVGRFDDFPVRPYGKDTDVAYEHLENVTADVDRVQAAVDSLDTGGSDSGWDNPESQVPALHRMTTHDGLGRFIPDSSGCLDGGRGRPCFRDDSLPVVMLFTDAPMHNGPRRVDRYDDGTLGLGGASTPLWADAMDAVNELGGKVLTIWSRNASSELYPDRSQYEMTAEATGAVTASGKKLVFDIDENGSGLSSRIVDAVTSLAGQVTRDVSTRWREHPAVDDGIEARELIASIRPARALPPENIAGMDDTTFQQVVPGTRVEFDVEFVNETVEGREDGPQLFVLRIDVMGDGRVLLDSRRVVVLVPPEVILI